ncbi:hypothetical protein TNCV_3874041 [Trichonephila clavipes]|nr:hypothetical protein TNCV_3874041 [Trichonephila clavipes]
MPSPGFESRPYGNTVSVTNHYTGWAERMTDLNSDNESTRCPFRSGFPLVTNEVSVTKLLSASTEKFAHVRLSGLDPKNLGGVFI